MIKLRDLLLENGGINEMSIKLYWNFVLNALSGHNPDAFYRQYRREIETIAEALTKKFGPSSGGTVYRGIILDPSEVQNGFVSHVDEITYVSFSEDKKIALAFADTENPMAEFMMQRYPHKKGFLITDTYTPHDLLFHHMWLGPTRMWPMIHRFFGEDAKFVEIQKEVMLKPKSRYKVELVPPGASGGIVVGLEERFKSMSFKKVD